MCITGKCSGGLLVLAGILLGLISLDILKPWLNLTSFFAIMLILVGIHSFACKDCCSIPETKKK